MPQRGPEDGVIDWNLEGEFIERFIRAQTRPYPGHSRHGMKRNFTFGPVSLRFLVSIENRAVYILRIANISLVVGRMLSNLMR